MDIDINELLEQAISAGASDIHLKVGSAPVMRIEGELRTMPGIDPLRPKATQILAESLMTPKAAEDFRQQGTADFAYGRHDIGRFRVTAFRQRGSVSMILRHVVSGSRSFAELGLPAAMDRYVDVDSGLILVTGPSGSGKSTTISAIVDWINTNKARAILTVEDPIEVLHPDKRSIVAQREVGVDTPHVAEAVRGAMRHDIDVIMVSELGDRAAARAAVDAAETGHLVVSSMRTTDPADTVNRLLAMFPETERHVVRGQLASQLVMIVSQRLIDTAEGGLILACEILTNNERAQEWILSGSDPSAVIEIMREGAFHGMQTFDQALLDHITNRVVKIEAALPHVRNSHEIRAKAMAAGVTV